MSWTPPQSRTLSPTLASSKVKTPKSRIRLRLMPLKGAISVFGLSGVIVGFFLGIKSFNSLSKSSSKTVSDYRKFPTSKYWPIICFTIFLFIESTKSSSPPTRDSPRSSLPCTLNPIVLNTSQINTKPSRHFGNIVSSFLDRILLSDFSTKDWKTWIRNMCGLVAMFDNGIEGGVDER